MPLMFIVSTLRVCLAMVLVVVATSATALAVETSLHVALAGDDAATGTATAPLATPQRALERVAEIAAASPTADVRVVLRGGTFRIKEPLRIECRHVPAQGSLTLAGADGERVIISGGQLITDWTVNDNGSWSSTTASTKFRELFVDGQRRPRARHPNAGYARIEKAFENQRTGFTFVAGDMPETWTGGGELVFLHDWSTSRMGIQSVAHDTRRLTVEFPIGNHADHYRIDYFEPHPRYFVENHHAFLDAPGEWVLADDGTLTYLPLPRETPDTCEVVAPLAESLLIVVGDDGAAVRNVHVQNLEFQHCAWPLPPGGFAGSQASAFEDRSPQPTTGSSRPFVPAALTFERAESCSFTSGRIAHLGTSGIQFGSCTSACRLEDTIIEDVSGNGVNLGEDTSRTVQGRAWWEAAPEQAAAGHLIAHNRIERCGEQFFGAVAVWVGIARQMQITHNEIAQHPYTGISLGWMWNPTPTPASGHVVSQNHIHHVMQVLSDGGGIYTLGRQPGMKLIENVIHDIPPNAGRAESNGMFLDEGSDRSTVAGNVIYGVACSPLQFHKAEQIKVHGNTLVLPSTDTPSMRYNNTDLRNILQWDNRVVPQARFDPATVTLPPTGPR